MCEPTTIAMAGLSIAGSASTLYSQQKAGADQAQYESDLYTQTSNISLQNYLRQTQAVGNQLTQQAAAASQSAEASSLQTAQAQSAANVSAGERGINGNSVHLLLSDFARHEAQNNFNLRTNLGWMSAQSSEELVGLRAQTQAHIAGATPNPVVMPSGIGAALQIGSAVVGAVDRHQQISRSGVYDPANKSSTWMYKPLFSS